MSSKKRVESDLLGEVELDNSHLYGVQTARAIDNFKFSPFKLNDYPHFVEGLALTKKGAAMANHQLGLLTDEQAKAIEQACDEILAGKHHEHFVVDMFQGGAGTSTNMNANEVITNRALEIMGYERGDYKHLSPNDHTNHSQSTNDAYPTAIHLGLYKTYVEMIPHIEKLIKSFRAKGEEFKDIIKMGRTQLQDAVPMTLGQTFNAFASILEEELPNLKHACDQLLVNNMGSTAIGTGICSVPGYREACAKALSEITGWNVTMAKDMVAATSDTSHMIGFSAAIKRIAVKLSKISNDLRILSSGPRAGLSEINLPARQPGSSIMPGKVNPVIPEVVTQVAMKIIGNDVCVTMAGEASQMELNAMEPIMAQCCFESARLFVEACDTLRTLCVDGITANSRVTEEQVHNSIGVVTALNPYIGYKNSTKIAKEAITTGKGIVEIVLEKGILSKEQLDQILAPENLIKPVRLDIKPLKNFED
ncbi:aspartate ammonia-lyase [uncultured Porphyromonas sp.]|uniref:aspartate ammonia-lyase n=1 Tax=uncultured Porphyromonas sp. TaxID=159274 RepID=UPI002617AF01|nr:aspartate ammonia-lyase [uncultured Porphyromonas sp.]